jgi:hypothetical protein
MIACNQAEIAGGLVAGGHALTNIIEGNTIVFNHGSQGVSGVQFIVGRQDHLSFARNLVAYNLTGGLECWIFDTGYGVPDFACNDIEGNNPEFQTAECGAVIGVNGNISEDPMFGAVAGCPPANGDLCLANGSPLLPENSPPGCGLIGARGLCSQIGIADETAAPEADGDRISAQPNPFTTRTTLVIDLVAPAEIDLRITNALGRVVTEESLGSLHAGRHRWTWDGRDAAGHRAPAGVYYAEVQTGGRAIVTRLMVLR